MKMYTILTFGLLAISFLQYSCSNNETGVIEIDTSEFHIDDEYIIELVASEPLLTSPVYSTIDQDGAIWVVEMPGYMRDIDGTREDVRDGKIIKLTDTNDDGIMDKREVILDKLLNPRSILHVYGGMLYTDSTSLIWRAMIDDQLGLPVVVDSSYILGGNIEHQPNGLFYNIDNWIYSAKSNVRYKRYKGKWIKSATEFRGQWGMSADQSGRLVYNYNSAPMITDNMMPNQLSNNPHLKIEYGNGKLMTTDNSIYPIRVTAVNRGYEAGVLDSSGKVTQYTSACSPEVYYGNALMDDDYADIFVCTPEANMITQYDVDYRDQSAVKSSLHTKKEFLVSEDESFRPVSIATGYDGSLYVTDMRKGIIQHTAYMSSYLREIILAKGLDKINGKGRIYRIRAKAKAEVNNMHSSDEKDQLTSLGSDNFNIRIESQKNLIHSYQKGKLDKDNLLNLLSDSIMDVQKIHLMWILDETDHLNSKILLKDEMQISDFSLLPALSPLWRKYDAPWVNNVDKQYLDIYRNVLKYGNRASTIQIAPNLAGNPKYWKELIMMIRNYEDDIEMVEAVMSGISEYSNFEKLIDREKKLQAYKYAISTIHKAHNDSVSFAPKYIEETVRDDRTVGLSIFQKNCATCHGYDGKGLKNLAPSLTESKILKGAESKIASIILNGYESGSGLYQMKMPLYRNDPQMSDQDISDLVSYLISTFAKKWGGISPEEIKDIRENTISKSNKSQY